MDSAPAACMVKSSVVENPELGCIPETPEPQHVNCVSAVLITNISSELAYGHIPALKLPEHLKGIMKHHEDFVCCEDVSTADAMKEAMQLQRSDLLFRDQKVKVTAKADVIEFR